MIFLAPALLCVLVGLPLLWWLLRATPPAPRVQDFPAIRLLAGLRQNEETPARTPPWLLALRLLAAGLLVLGAAGPVLRRAPPAPGASPMLLVVDDGWASAHDWQRRLQACDGMLADAARAGRRAALLTTAPDDDGAAPTVTAFEAADALRERVAALRPHPWPVDRAAAAAALASVPAGSADVAYVADGVATPEDGTFEAAMQRVGSVADLRDTVPARLMLAPVATADSLELRLAGTAPTRPATVLAIDERGGALARVRLGPSRPDGDGWIQTGRIDLPMELRNELARIAVAGAPTAATTRLLDESDRRRPVGLLDTDAGSDTPLLGSLFYVSRGLQTEAELRRGGLDALLSRPLSVMIAADQTFADPRARQRVEDWVRNGGMLIRFAGPRLAAEDADDEGGPEDGSASDGSDPLLPVELLPGSRALGGAMSWGKPQHLAPFPPGSPFAGLTVPSEVTVSRQVLARPSLDLAQRSWVMLKDGTPLVTAKRLGHGRVVLFHVTANADWSNLPLSGLFVQMLERLTRLAAGIAAPGDRTVLAPVLTMDANGALGAPTQAAIGLAADAFGTVGASPRHPPGLYGRLAERRSLNLADTMAVPAPEALTGRELSLERHGADLALGPWLLWVAGLLLAADLAASLAVRGLLRRGAVAAIAIAAIFLAAGGGEAEATAPGPLPAQSPRAALETELAYVVTGNDEVDGVSRDGLSALSDYVNARTAAVLGTPAGVVPGRDDLSFYPLIYWPVLPDAQPDPKALAALDGYMRTGGVVLIDTEGGDATSPGSGAGFAPGASAALRRVAGKLDVPPLAPLSTGHVLAHSFYLLRDFPGRFVGAPVWVERGGDPSNDGVSTVVIGSNAWAAAWAVGAGGQPEFATVPGGEDQRLTAFRFGVNLVMYALTGNYKSDQVHVPALLQRLGEDGGGLGSGATVSTPDDAP